MIGRKPSIARPRHGASLPVLALTALLMPRPFLAGFIPFGITTTNGIEERNNQMGIGSYGICNDEQEAICIDCLDFDEWDYEDVRDNILFCLPPSFTTTAGRENDHRIIAENALFTVQITDHEHDIGLRIRIRPDLYEYTPDTTGLAKANLERTAAGIFDRLSRIYNLRVKTSGYTSAPYQLQCRP